MSAGSEIDAHGVLPQWVIFTKLDPESLRQQVMLDILEFSDESMVRGGVREILLHALRNRGSKNEGAS